MARCLLAWELGANFGHLVALRALARELRRQGHECVFAVRTLGDAQALLEPELGPLAQAPLRLGQGRRPVRRQISYASLLHNAGFNDPLELAGRIRAWRTLYRAFGTEFVFADHSPVALIAARTLGIPASAIGNGFTLPPRLAPFPCFRARAGAPESVLLRNEARVLGELNAALARLKLRPFELLQDIFRGARPALLSYPALDPYEAARPERFLGMPDYSYGRPPEWPQGKGPKIFAYLRPGAGMTALLQSLRRSRTRVAVRWPAEAAPPAVAWPGLTVYREPVNFRAAAESCDAFINYGAHATVAEFLLAGKPGILLPDLQERALTARRAVALGAAVAVPRTARPGMSAALERVLEDRAPRAAAQAFAAQHAREDRSAILPRLIADAV
jgi:UDP:flavonoid glycosyltransferase YjiC (YdhE family)